MEDIKCTAEQMLDRWCKEYSDGLQGQYPSTSLDGNMALTETTRHRRMRGQGFRDPMSAKETRRAGNSGIVITRGSEEIERIMTSMRMTAPLAYRALKLSVEGNQMREVARKMAIGYRKALESRGTGLAIVCSFIMANRLGARP